MSRERSKDARRNPGAPQVRIAVDPSLRLVNLQRANEANNEVLWVMTLWLRITAVL